VAVPTRTLTDFLQHSGQVLTELDEGEVVLRRRQGDDLVVLSRSHWEAVLSSIRLLAEAHRPAPTASSDATASRVWLSLPWLALLEPEDRQACIEELTAAALAAVESGRLRTLADILSEWRATALATWDASRLRDRPGYFDDAPVSLPRP